MPGMTGPVFVPLHGGTLATSVGLETSGGVFTPLLFRGDTVPCAVTEGFTTADDNQPSIKIRVFHSLEDRIAHATFLRGYQVILPGNAPRGVPNVAVTFAVTASGEFELTAADADRDLPVVLS